MGRPFVFYQAVVYSINVSCYAVHPDLGENWGVG
jgi:hypothetical protein